MKENCICMLIDDDVDDQEIFLYAVRELKMEIECTFARDGGDALAKLAAAEKKPDYIFLDLNMAPVDGRSCLRALKEDAHLNQIPVIIYSTSSDPRDRSELMAMGAAGYWVKDVSISKLCEGLKLLLQGQEAVQKTH